MYSSKQRRLAAQVLAACRARGLLIATAESCTGGLVSGRLTAVAGSSSVVDRAFVTYTNEAKTDMLGVAPDLFETKGAVSEDVARAMAEGAIGNSNAALAVAITGIAGPGGGTAEKPVGLVHFATALKGGETRHERHRYGGDREFVRERAVETALRMLLALALDQGS